jgi:hypothetical protein
MDMPLEQEWKKGSAELLILALLEDQPRHGYNIGKLIESRSGGKLRFHIASLYPRKTQSKKAALLPFDSARSKDSGPAAPQLEGICRRGQPNHGGGKCLTGNRRSANNWRG